MIIQVKEHSLQAMLYCFVYKVYVYKYVSPYYNDPGRTSHFNTEREDDAYEKPTP